MENQKQTILVVDDTLENIELLDHLLNRKYHVKKARSGQQALELAVQTIPALVLLDITMPKMDGYETCKRLKEDARTREIPIIFITVKNTMADVNKGFEAGAVDYVTKPFNLKELLARINAHLTIRRQKIQLAESEKIAEMTGVF